MNFDLLNMQGGYGENALVCPGNLGEEDENNNNAACKERAMFTVRFFDILTGANGVSHPVEYNRVTTGKTAIPSARGWFKRH